MNVQEITQAYNKLLEEVKTDKFYTKINLANRVNAWICESQGVVSPHIHGCKDIDAGVTPFIIQCRVCGGEAKSVFYRIHPDAITSGRIKIEYEWYRPSLEETLKETPAMIDHILKGGLKMRKIEEQKGEQKHD